MTIDGAMSDNIETLYIKKFFRMSNREVLTSQDRHKDSASYLELQQKNQPILLCAFIHCNYVYNVKIKTVLTMNKSRQKRKRVG